MKIETDIKGGAIIFEKYELIAYLQAKVAELEKQVAELKKFTMKRGKANDI